VVGPVLISAYDLHKGYFEAARASYGTSVFDSPLIFIDSGGYELLSACNPEWSSDLHAQVLAAWPETSQTVAVAYDTPSADLGAQIDAALSILPGRSIGRELLVKLPPEPSIDMLNLVPHLRGKEGDLAKIDVIGVTEKEAGDTLRERLHSISALRRTLDSMGLETPIHVFGGLDPVLTPLYFLAGADIFDGLTWLRYGFDNGRASYLQALALTQHPLLPVPDAKWTVRKKNYSEVTLMQISMLRFLTSGRPSDLHPQGDFLVRLFNDLMAGVS
jgi:hypothetical protein